MPEQHLRIADLRVALDLTLDAVESEHGPTLALDHDHYWHLPVRNAFNLSADPPHLTVGQTSDDLATVGEIAAAGAAFPTWHALAHVIGLLRAVELAARDRP